MKIIGKFGLAALDAGAVWSVCLSGSAQTPDIFTKHVMARPKIDRLKPKRFINQCCPPEHKKDDESMSQEKPIPNLCPKVILEGTRMTHKTEIAFALNEHPRFVGPRKYRYHSPIISAEWGGLQNRAWGQSLINFDKVHERRALETFDLWLRLIEQPHLSWIVDRFHHSTMMYQKLYHLRTYHFDRIEARLAGLGFRLVLCYREPSTFAKARMERLKISGNPSQYDNLEMFSREQDELFHLFERTTLPKLIVDTSDDDVVRMTEEVVNWFQLHSAENAQRAGHLSREPDVVRAAPQLAPVSERNFVTANSSVLVSDREKLVVR